MNEIDEGHGDNKQQSPHEEQWARLLQTANLGRLVMTAAAAKVLEETETEPMVLLWRHATGDWGQVEQDDREANDRAIVSGLECTYSNYRLVRGQCIWVVTEADRSATLMCLPDEYL